uniref:Xylulose kinase-1 n=1 Tax=Tanacetum cinerariifolium TaxID=118510 RepID=A0A699GN67_TANCI|nr:hypothetical protein [Tanacetum cinerariifolium]
MTALNVLGHLDLVRKAVCSYWNGICISQMFQVLVKHHTSNGYQFTMSNRRQELTSPEQTISVKSLQSKANGSWHFITAVSYKLMLFGLTKDADVHLNVASMLLVVNPTIYVSCIKQFWASATIKKVNDVVHLHALIDRKNVVVTEDVIRQDLHLDDADGIECLPNEEIFTELALIINAQVDDLTCHNTKYTSPALTQKATEEDGEVEVPIAPAPPSPTSTPLPPPQDPIPAPPQAQSATPSSPTPEQPTKTFESSIPLMNTLLETRATLSQKERIDQDVSAATKDVSAAEPTVFDDEEEIPKSKEETIAQARKNMIIYLKNMAGYKMEHFRGMTYDKKIIRVGGITEAYQSFKDMLKGFDREDLVALWSLVKEKFSSAVPNVDKEKALWVELKRLFKPDANNVL